MNVAMCIFLRRVSIAFISFSKGSSRKHRRIDKIEREESEAALKSLKSGARAQRWGGDSPRRVRSGRKVKQRPGPDQVECHSTDSRDLCKGQVHRSATMTQGPPQETSLTWKPQGLPDHQGRAPVNPVEECSQFYRSTHKQMRGMVLAPTHHSFSLTHTDPV